MVTARDRGLIRAPGDSHEHQAKSRALGVGAERCRSGRAREREPEGGVVNTWGGHYMGGGGNMMILGVVIVVAIVWIVWTRSRRNP